jgi:hypothetical protein
MIAWDDFFLGAIYFGMALAVAGGVCRMIADWYPKPGQQWSGRSLGWLEFYEPKGRIWLRLSRWLRFGGMLIVIATVLYNDRCR